MDDAARQLQGRVIERALRGPGKATAAARRDAFENKSLDDRSRALVQKVARHAWKITDADIASARAAGLTEDEIFELTVCAALGQATRQLNAALLALDAAAPAGAPSTRLDPDSTQGGTR